MTDREAHTPSVGGYCDSEIYLQCSCGWEESGPPYRTWDDHLIAAGLTLTPSLDERLLARALDVLYERRWGLPPYPGRTTVNLEDAKAIAAEYRRLAQEGETPEPTPDEAREYRLDATDPANQALNYAEWRAHRSLGVLRTP